MKRPSIFWHMIRWGFASGTILAALYFAAMQDSVMDVIEMLISIDMWGFVAMFGGLPGVVLGVVDAFFLWFLIRRLPRPFTQEAMKSSRFNVYALTSILTFTGGLGLTSPIWMVASWEYFTFTLLFSLGPSFIAATAATYAVHRYLFRLRLYDEPNHSGKYKGKPKLDMSRLQDSVEESEIYKNQDDSQQRHERKI